MIFLEITSNENAKLELEINTIKEFENSIMHKNKCYKTKLLWKMDPENSDNYEIIESDLYKRFKQNYYLKSMKKY